MEVTENSLHAYVDGAVSAEERNAVEAYLAANPEAAARVRAYLAQNAALHQLYDRVLSEPHRLSVAVPNEPASRASSVPSKPAANAPRFWLRAGGWAALLVCGVVIGFIARGYLESPAGLAQRGGIARQAVLAHAAYRPEVRHPVEVGAQEEQHLVAWLSKRLNLPLRAPSLLGAGYQLLGGRLLPAAGELGDAPVALLMYENAQGRRLSLLLRHEKTSGDTAFRFAQHGDTRVFYWIDGPIGCALAGDISKEELARIAHLVYEQLNPS
jgi:anti-sigma factor RsiW